MTTKLGWIEVLKRDVEILARMAFASATQAQKLGGGMLRD